LAEGSVPVYKILEEKLHLTKKQIGEIGKQKIPASTAINALVDGMTERFGSVVDASATTMQGMISNIKDYTLMLFAEAFLPMTNNIKSLLAEFGVFLTGVKEAMDKFGIGGVFEKLVPPSMRPLIKELIGSFMNLFNALRMIGSAVGKLASGALLALANMLRFLLPPVVLVVQAFAWLAQIITRNETAMKWLSYAAAIAGTMFVFFSARMMLLWLLKPLIGVVMAMSGALLTLGKAMLANPASILLAVLAGAFIAVAMSATAAGRAIRSFFGGLVKASGVDTDKLLLPSQKSRASDLEKFNKALDGTGKGMDELADSTGKAAKAAKGLLSFDEVYTLKSPDAAAGAGDGGIDAGDIGAGFDVADIEVPNIEDFVKDFSANITDALKDRIKSTLIGAGIGAVIGGVIGTELGNPVLGAKIGAGIGALVGFLWPEISKWWMGWTTDLGTKLGNWYYDATVNVKKWAEDSVQAVSDWSTRTSDDIANWLLDTEKGFTGWWDGIGSGFNSWVSVTTDDLSNWLLNTETGFNTWTTNTGTKLGTWYSDTKEGFKSMGEKAGLAVTVLTTAAGTRFDTLKTNATNSINTLKTNVTTKFGEIKNSLTDSAKTAYTNVTTKFSGMYDSVKAKMAELGTNIKTAASGMLTSMSGWASDMWTKVFGKVTEWIAKAIAKFKDMYAWARSVAAVVGVKLPAPVVTSSLPDYVVGHATGGVFDREHLAIVNERNKREAVIPLETSSGMQPFVDAVANGLVATLAPLMAGNNGNQLPPVYVGTLIADDRGLKELERKMTVIRLQESRRLGD
jgi:hypothetical protein